MPRNLAYYTILYYTISYSILLYSTILCYTMLYYTIRLAADFGSGRCGGAFQCHMFSLLQQVLGAIAKSLQVRPLKYRAKSVSWLRATGTIMDSKQGHSKDGHRVLIRGFYPRPCEVREERFQESKASARRKISIPTACQGRLQGQTTAYAWWSDSTPCMK